MENALDAVHCALNGPTADCSLPEVEILTLVLPIASRLPDFCRRRMAGLILTVVTAKKKRRRGKRQPSRELGRPARFLVVILSVIGLSTASLALLVRYVEHTLPQVPSFEEYVRQVPKVSRILARDGTVLAEFYVERRTVMFPRQVPEALEKAILAAEDANFYQHGGLSYWGIMRAMAVDLWRGRFSQGGSTITQQVVKQVLLSPERTLGRKFKELLLARLMENKLGKREILAMYASEVYLGHGCYGFEEAARFYFGKHARDLTVGEAALLAGLVQAPERDSPLEHPDRAARRQRYVLRRMAEEGFITWKEAEKAATRPMALIGRSDARPLLAPYFVDAVRREVLRMFGPGCLTHEGLTIWTTLDPKIAQAANIALAYGLAHLFVHGRRRRTDRKGAARVTRADPGMPKPPGVALGRVDSVDRAAGKVVVNVGGDPTFLDLHSLQRIILAGHPDIFGFLKRRKHIWVSSADREVGGLPVVNAELGPQAAVVVLRALDRGVVALIGGENFQAWPYNRAVQSRRPVGSVVKPFLYALALQRGWTPNSRFVNAPLRLRGRGGTVWTPHNFGGAFDGKEYTLAEALAKSLNIVAVRVMRRVGPGPVAAMLADLGFDGDIPRELSLALGSATASPLAVANAFAVFAADGRYDAPYLITSVQDAWGRVVMRHVPRPERRVPAKISRTMRRLLRRVVKGGTAHVLSPLPLFAKTGTTNGSRETWLVSSDGYLVVCVFVGYDDRLRMPGATGGNTAAPIARNLFLMLSPRGLRAESD